MKAQLGIAGLYVLVMIQSAFASLYSMGYDSRCSDAGKKPSARYINQERKGAAFHTSEFMTGHRARFATCGGPVSEQGFITSSSGSSSSSSSSSSSNGNKVIINNNK